jgi:hypothetical protein
MILNPLVVLQRTLEHFSGQIKGEEDFRQVNPDIFDPILGLSQELAKVQPFDPFPELLSKPVTHDRAGARILCRGGVMPLPRPPYALT